MSNYLIPAIALTASLAATATTAAILLNHDDYPKLITWLDEADDGYIRMFQHRDVRAFLPYVAKGLGECLDDYLAESPARLFGVRKYRRRTWNIEKTENGIVTVRKELRHANVTIQQGVQLTMGDDITQIWKIHLQDKNIFEVFEIQEVPACMQ